MTGLPKYDIFDALSWYTGGSWCPNTNAPEWLALDKRLKELDLTGMQFCHFFLYVYPKGRERARLTWKNLLCCDETWVAFLKHRPTVMVDTKERIKSQRKEVQSYVDYGHSMMSMLTGRIADINSIVRIEMAYQAHQKDPDFNAVPVIAKYEDEAFELMLGVPEYIPYCPLLSKAIEEGRFDVSK
jgi:hypothetical protein